MSEKKSPMEGHGPPLHALRVFEVVARRGSLVAAAGELHVTPGAVSRQVRQLEDALGQPLFERRNRAVFITPVGRELQQACEEALERLGKTWLRLRRAGAPAPLVLSCEPTIAMRWLIPRLPDFQAHHPEVRLHLLTAGGPVDFRRDGVDVALRRDDFKRGPGLHEREIGEEWMGPVCAPSLLKPRRRLNEAARLHARSRPRAWAEWQRQGGELPLGADQAFEHFYLSLQAAGAGLGVALGSIYMVVDELQAGRLAAPAGFRPDGSRYLLLSPEPWENDPRRLALADWLAAQMELSRCSATPPPPR